MNLLKAIGIGGTAAGADTAATGAAAVNTAGQAAASGGGTGGFLSGLIKTNQNLQEGVGAGTASQELFKMFGGKVSDDTVNKLNEFQVQNSTDSAKARRDSLLNTTDYSDNMFRLLGFLG